MNNNLITKVTIIITRDDGSEARIVATAMQPIMNPSDVDFYVHRRSNANSPWQLCGDRAKAKTRSEHLSGGRAEMFSYVTPGELLTVKALIGKPMGSEQGISASFDTRPPMARTSYLQRHKMVA